MKRRTRVKVNLDLEVAEILDAIADEIGADDLLPKPSRSDLLNKGALLYIHCARKKKKLRLAIQRVEAKQATAKSEDRKLPRLVPKERTAS
jgi:hypothetical protein